MFKMILGIFIFYSGLFLEVYFFVSRLSSLPPPLTPDTVTTYPAAVHPNYNKIWIVSHYLKDHSWCGCCFYPNYFSSPAPSHPVLLFSALQRHPAFSLLSPAASEWSAVFYKIFKRRLPYHSWLSPMSNKCFLYKWISLAVLLNWGGGSRCSPLTKSIQMLVAKERCL